MLLCGDFLNLFRASGFRFRIWLQNRAPLQTSQETTLSSPSSPRQPKERQQCFGIDNFSSKSKLNRFLKAVRLNNNVLILVRFRSCFLDAIRVVQMEKLVTKTRSWIKTEDVLERLRAKTGFLLQFPSCAEQRVFPVINFSRWQFQKLLLHGIAKLANKRDPTLLQLDQHHDPAWMSNHFSDMVVTFDLDGVHYQIDKLARVNVLALEYHSRKLIMAGSGYAAALPGCFSRVCSLY